MTDSPRRPGPPPPIAVRTAGEAALLPLLEEAVALSGRVERATHGFHTYPAGLHPDAAKMLIAHFPGHVHDPFCGGGTVLVEALLQGRSASGCDLSPIALLVARARTAHPSMATPLRAASRRLAEGARLRLETEVPELCQEWYEPHVAYEIGRLRDGISVEEPELRPLLRAVLSSIIVKASFRESDTSNRRVPGHRPPGTTAVLFHKKARELGRAIEELPAERSVDVRGGDATRVPPPEGTGLILTSPPYPGVYDYMPMQQLRLAWLGLDPGPALAAEIGSRRSFRAQGRGDAFRRWREDTAAWISTQASRLVSGGHLIMMVGDGLVGDRNIDALSPTVEALRAAGLEVVGRASADRPDHARERVRTEHLIVARKS